MAHGRPEGENIAIRGPFADKAAFDQGHDRTPTRFSAEQIDG